MADSETRMVECGLFEEDVGEEEVKGQEEVEEEEEGREEEEGEEGLEDAEADEEEGENEEKGGDEEDDEVDHDEDDDEETEEKVVLAEVFALSGWCSSISHTPYHVHPVQYACVIPSPFAEPQCTFDIGLWNLLPGPVQQLWKAFCAIPKPSERRVPSDGSVACFGLQSKGCNIVPVKYWTMGPGQNELLVDVGDNNQAFHLRRLRRAVGQRITTQEGFFVINNDFDRLLINGQAMDRGAVVGPLPNLAVIELDSVAIFWWRDRQAFDYTPDLKQSIHPLYLGPVCGNENGLWRDPRPLKRSRDTEDGSESKRLKPNPHHNESDKTARPDESGRVVPPPPPGKSTTNTPGDSVREDDTHRQQAITSNPNIGQQALLPQHPPHLEPLLPYSASAQDPDQAQSPTSWKKLLETGVKVHRQSYKDKKAQQAAKKMEQFWRISRPQGLADDDTIHAIATFWEALRLDGQLFAFAGVDVFAQTNSMDPGFQLKSQGVVGAPNKFIMPLLLHPQHRKGAKAAETAALGHLVLGLAEYWPDKDKVRLDFVDSLARNPGASSIYKKGMIKRAKELITESRWPYSVQNQQAPSFLLKVTTIPSPHQEGGNTCGFYMILNAWCVMLGIPICETSERRGDKYKQRQFLADGREIINLALMGCMDAITVQAFLNVWGYSQDQPLEDVVRHKVRAEAMNIERLRDALYLQAVVEGSVQAVVEGGVYKPTVAEVTALIQRSDLPVTYEQMEAALVDKDGDADAAVGSLLQPSLVAPTAGEAPQTEAHVATEGEEEEVAASPSESEKNLRIYLKTPSPSPTAEGNVADASEGGP